MKGLILDGGGCFGIGQARILDKVDTSKFDFFVGTSIGSANAAVLASGIDINLTDYFHEDMPKIFRGYWWRRFLPTTPRFPAKAINKSLQNTFDGICLGDVKKPLFITTVSTSTEKLKVFHSNDPADAGMHLWECVRCSTAAPTYFNPYKGYVDGGVYANFPAVVGIAGVCAELGCKVEDLELCSIGTGVTPGSKKISKWSFLSWGIWLLQAMLNGSSSSMNDFICRQLPLKKYTRIQFIRDKKWSMDSAKDMLKAEKAWEDDITHGIEIVNNF